MSSLVQRVAVQCSGALVAVTACVGLAGCGDGGGAVSAETPVTSQTVTQSDIVLPSSVQGATAK